jgi:hypothetical protein
MTAGDPMRGLLLARISDVRRKGVVKGLAIDVLGREWQVLLERHRQRVIRCIRHGSSFRQLEPKLDAGLSSRS